ncbi:uncharacterized protein VTP21DRAFT_8931 [Calcarisporiella thermophila]|uniref:uncharacterized protein n=1 Tax=Calcarisporiella thermophila TaxID=911321 RepID=UPI0037441F65
MRLPTRIFRFSQPSQSRSQSPTATTSTTISSPPSSSLDTRPHHQIQSSRQPLRHSLHSYTPSLKKVQSNPDVSFVRAVRLLQLERERLEHHPERNNPFLELERELRDRAIFVGWRISRTLAAACSNIREEENKQLVKSTVGRLFTYYHVRDVETTLREQVMLELESEASSLGLDIKHTGVAEAIYAVKYTLDVLYPRKWSLTEMSSLLRRASECVRECIESETRLTPAERECMFVFHRLKSGIDWDREPVEPIAKELVRATEEIRLLEEVVPGIDHGKRGPKWEMEGMEDLMGHRPLVEVSLL